MYKIPTHHSIRSFPFTDQPPQALINHTPQPTSSDPHPIHTKSLLNLSVSQPRPPNALEMHPLLLILLVLVAAICFIRLTRLVWRAVGVAMRIGWRVLCVAVRAVGTCVCLFWVVVFFGLGVWFVVAAVGDDGLEGLEHML